MVRSWIRCSLCLASVMALLSAGLCQQTPAPPAGGAKPKGVWANPAWPKLRKMLDQNPETRLAYLTNPGLIAAFGFTDEQITQFGQAYDATNPESIYQTFKQKVEDPNIKPEDKPQLYNEYEAQKKAAVEELQKKLDAILTPEQKTLMQKINEACKAAVKALNDTLDQALTPEQKQRMASFALKRPAEKPK